MPYTRKKYIRGIKPAIIRKFEMGNPKGKFSRRVLLKAMARAQVRDNALSAARVAANRAFRDLGEENYFLKIHVYPHQMLRENKMIVGAHADRLQKGMKKAFGRVIGNAARVNVNQVLMSALVNEDRLEVAKQAFSIASHKLPIPCRIVVETIGD